MQTGCRVPVLVQTGCQFLVQTGCRVPDSGARLARVNKNALGANLIIAQKSPTSGVFGVIGVYI